jgi:hypothetical protein
MFIAAVKTFIDFTQKSRTQESLLLDLAYDVSCFVCLDLLVLEFSRGIVSDIKEGTARTKRTQTIMASESMPPSASNFSGGNDGDTNAVSSFGL